MTLKVLHSLYGRDKYAENKLSSRTGKNIKKITNKTFKCCIETKLGHETDNLTVYNSIFYSEVNDKI